MQTIVEADYIIMVPIQNKLQFPEIIRIGNTFGGSPVGHIYLTFKLCNYIILISLTDGVSDEQYSRCGQICGMKSICYTPLCTFSEAAGGFGCVILSVHNSVFLLYCYCCKKSTLRMCCLYACIFHRPEHGQNVFWRYVRQNNVVLLIEYKLKIIGEILLNSSDTLQLHSGYSIHVLPEVLLHLLQQDPLFLLQYRLPGGSVCH